MCVSGAAGVIGFLWRYLGAYLRWRSRGYGHLAAYRRIPFEIEAEWRARRAPIEGGVPRRIQSDRDRRRAHLTDRAPARRSGPPSGASLRAPDFPSRRHRAPGGLPCPSPRPSSRGPAGAHLARAAGRLAESFDVSPRRLLVGAVALVCIGIAGWRLLAAAAPSGRDAPPVRPALAGRGRWRRPVAGRRGAVRGATTAPPRSSSTWRAPSSPWGAAPAAGQPGDRCARRRRRGPAGRRPAPHQPGSAAGGRAAGLRAEARRGGPSGRRRCPRWCRCRRQRCPGPRRRRRPEHRHRRAAGHAAASGQRRRRRSSGQTRLHLGRPAARRAALGEAKLEQLRDLVSVGATPWPIAG